ncbi:uncharacterized protein LOC110824500 [Carica papaya]|uniref:uncharacterized protein LOC110824500 n=1 Tax=Carica papaya TaxID=3649 RepID=UPI000B8CE0BF|nr:uncharacterized protein LOC110824500 [Carica papaya]
MSSKTQQAILLLLVTTWITMLVQPGVAQLLPGLPQINQCLGSLNSIQGCIISIFTFPIGGLIPSSPCCNAFLNITTSCQSIIFPLAPSTPSLIQSYCNSPKASPPLTK